MVVAVLAVALVVHVEARGGVVLVAADAAAAAADAVAAVVEDIED